jgi:hypothetical protein
MLRRGQESRELNRLESTMPDTAMHSNQPRGSAPKYPRGAPRLVASLSCRAPRGWDRNATHNEYRVHATRRIPVQLARRRCLHGRATQARCFECFRAERERRARLPGSSSATRPRSPFAAEKALEEAGMQHRRQMLSHLESKSR